jgi:hypothetical protein
MVRPCGYSVQAGFTLGHLALVWPAEWLEPREGFPAKRRAVPCGPGFHRGRTVPCRLDIDIDIAGVRDLRFLPQEGAFARLAKGIHPSA